MIHENKFQKNYSQKKTHKNETKKSQKRNKIFKNDLKKWFTKMVSQKCLKEIILKYDLKKLLITKMILKNDFKND